MTVSTPVIKRFSTRSVVALPGGQQVQVLPSIDYLPRCQKYQSAAFISDRSMLVIWNDDPTAIIEQAQRMERELLAMIWKAEAEGDLTESKKLQSTVMVNELPSESSSTHEDETEPSTKPSYKVNLTLPLLVATAICLVTTVMGDFFAKLLEEAAWDGSYTRFALVVVIPLLSFLALVSR